MVLIGISLVVGTLLLMIDAMQIILRACFKPGELFL